MSNHEQVSSIHSFHRSNEKFIFLSLQKRSNPHDHHGSKSSKQQHSKGKQSQQNPPKESKPVNSPKPKFEETATAPAEAPPKRDTASNEGANHNHESNPSDDRSNKAGSTGSQKVIKSI